MRVCVCVCSHVHLQVRACMYVCVGGVVVCVADGVMTERGRFILQYQILWDMVCVCACVGERGTSAREKILRSLSPSTGHFFKR